ncbi:MAG: toll/interleukin-1 receptor domain-containing protein [Sinimarinibacterium flocculans]|uniref:toll/interleukin-1 receptor domain-containing protein n=1 Tax=Sinimarinibacterium flocculans TaxID=985250 RepID=UPI003C3E41CE
MADPDDPVDIFISYSHADSYWRQRLETHLAPLERSATVSYWSDRRLLPGSNWRNEIREAIARSKIAIFLVSADFLASDFIRTHELPPLLDAAEDEGKSIFSIIVSPCLFLKTPELCKFQALNDPASPLVCIDKGEQERVFLGVAEGVMDRVEKIKSGYRSITSVANFREDFLNENHWSSLMKIGSWIFDREGKKILGADRHTYLLSLDEYGDSPFSIEATLSFSNFARPGEKGPLGMNAGIILGWTYENNEPRYYNLLITGSDVLVERCGFTKANKPAGNKHITAAKPLRIESGKDIRFEVIARGDRLRALVNGEEFLSIEQPIRIVGRVGLRPWRSTLECSRFVVKRVSEP